MRASSCIRAGALLAGLGVLLGAFTAHGLKERLTATALVTFETGVRYQLYHALGLLACGALGARGARTGPAAVCFAAGIALFSGSLYLLAALDVKWLGAVTPFGGVLFLVGWALLAWRGLPPAQVF